MSASLDPSALLTRFIDDEDAALAAGRQGKFWSSNHHEISSLVAKADRHLDPAQRVRLYGHVLRVAGTIPAVSEKEFPLLVEAYRAALPRVDTYGVGYLAGRLPLLFCFGFDELGALPSGQTLSAADLNAHL